jgi:hypothetical protein
MKNPRFLVSLVVLLMPALIVAVASGQEKKIQSSKVKVSPAPAIEPEAVAMIEKMEAFVKTLTRRPTRFCSQARRSSSAGRWTPRCTFRTAST